MRQRCSPDARDGLAIRRIAGSKGLLRRRHRQRSGVTCKSTAAFADAAPIVVIRGAPLATTMLVWRQHVVERSRENDTRLVERRPCKGTSSLLRVVGPRARRANRVDKRIGSQMGRIPLIGDPPWGILVGDNPLRAALQPGKGGPSPLSRVLPTRRS